MPTTTPAADDSTLHRLSRRLMLGLALFALALVLGVGLLATLGRFEPAPDGDEGAPARLFQLAVALLVPAGLVFAATADWRQPLRVLRGYAAPALALGLAFVALFYLERMP